MIFLFMRVQVFFHFLAPLPLSQLLLPTPPFSSFRIHSWAGSHQECLSYSLSFYFALFLSISAPLFFPTLCSLSIPIIFRKMKSIYFFVVHYNSFFSCFVFNWRIWFYKTMFLWCKLTICYIFPKNLISLYKKLIQSPLSQNSSIVLLLCRWMSEISCVAIF